MVLEKRPSGHVIMSWGWSHHFQRHPGELPGPFPHERTRGRNVNREADSHRMWTCQRLDLGPPSPQNREEWVSAVYKPPSLWHPVIAALRRLREKQNISQKSKERIPKEKDCTYILFNFITRVWKYWWAANVYRGGNSWETPELYLFALQSQLMLLFCQSPVKCNLVAPP